uniref:Uncharacterized protein n=1 Tax=Globodera rostochiensis TaxID=31243 RepID=A0A914IAI9_GLORO
MGPMNLLRAERARWIRAKKANGQGPSDKSVVRRANNSRPTDRPTDRLDSRVEEHKLESSRTHGQQNLT